MRGSIRRGLIVGGVSVALLAAAASSASAATMSPTSAYFGRLLIGKKSAPKTFTLTKGTETEFQLRPAIVSFPAPLGGSFPFDGTSDCPVYPENEALTAAHPSCTFTVRFTPDGPGPQAADVITNDIDPTAPTAHLTGIGLLPRKSFFCWKKNGHPLHPAYWKYCLKKKHHTKK